MSKHDDLARSIANPNHPERKEMLEWIGSDFDPEEYDLDEVNQSLQNFKPARGRRKSEPEPEPEPGMNNPIFPKSEARTIPFIVTNKVELMIFYTISTRPDRG